MKWAVSQIPPHLVTPEVLYDINRRHGLMLDDMERMVNGLAALAADASVYIVWSQDETPVATLIVSHIVDGESAEIDLIPVGKFFRSSFEDHLHAAARPVLDRLADIHKLRRFTAYVPSSRARAVKGLLALGFEEEGRMRQAVCLEGKPPEDLVILGSLEG